jgi:mRNA-degrading endonuclease RelE of RelBE toxin-antitoxin system
MDTTNITWKTKATKQLRKLDAQHAKQIVVAVRALTNMPACQNVKALTNHEYQYRLRVGSYRVFFNFDGAVRIVSIEEVKKRDERTY